jgi:hypothetical protein
MEYKLTFYLTMLHQVQMLFNVELYGYKWKIKRTMSYYFMNYEEGEENVRENMKERRGE